MKIHILWEFTENPWGGGNQFLKALKKQFVKIGVYTDNPADADIILFNSHQFQKQALQLKHSYPQTIFVHRVDGPLSQTRGETGISTDKKIFFCNNLIADGTVFQSAWSREESYRLGMQKNRFETCIINAPDPEIFYPKPTHTKNLSDQKIRLITTTWSSNPRKGFDIYHYLDEHLDFKKYSMTFVGNADKPFRNIEIIPPVPSEDLASILRSHDIFIAASKNEPCSNSFLEALHCGLPAIARNNSSYPELLDGNGMLFEGKEDVIEKIESVAQHLDDYQSAMSVVHISKIAILYTTFFQTIQQAVSRNSYFPKKLPLLDYCLSRIRLKKK